MREKLERHLENTCKQLEARVAAFRYKLPAAAARRKHQKAKQLQRLLTEKSSKTKTVRLIVSTGQRLIDFKQNDEEYIKASVAALRKQQGMEVDDTTEPAAVDEAAALEQLPSWAGDGSSFDVDLWISQYKFQPWLVEAAVVKATTGTNVGDGKAQEDILMMLDINPTPESEQQAARVVQDYKAKSAGLPETGIDASRVGLIRQRADMQAEADRRREAMLTDADRRQLADQEFEAEYARNTDFKMLKMLHGRKKATQMVQAAVAEKAEREEAGRREQEAIQAEARAQAQIEIEKKRAAKLAKERASNRGVARAVLRTKKIYTAFKLRGNKKLQSSVAAVKESQMLTLGVTEAIKDLKLTRGVFEMNIEATNSKKAMQENQTFFTRGAENLGTDTEPIYLWTMKTTNPMEAISDIQVHRCDDLTVNPAKNLIALSYEFYTHPSMEEYAFWFVRAMGKPVTAIGATFTERDNSMMQKSRYKPMKGGFEYRLDAIRDGTTFWLRKTKPKLTLDAAKSAAEVARDLERETIQQKIALFQERLEEMPENITLQQGLQQAESDLAEMEANDVQERGTLLQNAAVRQLALDQSELKRIRKSFDAADKHRRGFFYTDEFFELLEVCTAAQQPSRCPAC